MAFDAVPDLPAAAWPPPQLLGNWPAAGTGAGPPPTWLRPWAACIDLGRATPD